MQANVTEHDFGFWLELFPESQQEAIVLIRLGMNGTKEKVLFSTYCNQESVHTQMSISKRKQPVSKIKAGR
jgi:hypothetical protein